MVGPYRVTGSLLTHPGFDPEKSIARPGGSFIPLTEVTIELLGHPEAGSAERAHVHVNRYAVDRVTSQIMLGHYFPGAQLENRQPARRALRAALRCGCQRSRSKIARGSGDHHVNTGSDDHGNTPAR